jgi:hypothetical protein
MRFLFRTGAILCVLLAASSLPAANGRLLTADEARRLAVLVAEHDHIDTGDTHIEINSMDMGSEFIRGYASFIVIRESTSPGPDETLRRFAVSRRTGDVWETTLCTHYSFPELTRRQRALTGRIGSPGEVAAEQKELGCMAKDAGPHS